MPTRALALVTLACAALAQDPLRDALNLGHTRDAALFDAFNRGYALAASGTIDSAEIFTEFRRAVMIVREHDALGDYIQDTRTLTNALTPYVGRVAFVVQARLNPLNTFLKPPAYELYISTGPSTRPLVGTPATRDPVYPPGTLPGVGGSIAAVRLSATFARADIEAAAQPSLVLTDDHGQVMWQARIDLSRYR